MSAEMPELGSKISLISKADIRYEGQLFTVDSEESTIALANVRSFGTEDRAAKFPIEAQSQVYDYILFRGSDIKDIKIVNNVGPLNDPAIVQLSVPGSLGSSTYHQARGYSHPVLGPMAPGLTQYPNYSAMGAMTGLPSAMAPGMGLHRGDPRTLQRQPSELVNQVPVPEPTKQDQDLISAASPRSLTPSLIARKSPTMDQAVQVSQSVSIPIKEDKKQMPQSRQVQPMHPSRDGPVSRGTIGQQQYHPQPQREPRERDPRDHQGRDQQPVSFGPLPQRTQQVPMRGGWVNRGGMRRGRGRGGSGGYNRQGSGQPIGGNKKNALKFESDFDFDAANEEFDKVRIELAKTKIDSEPVITGDGKGNEDNEKKDDSGNETGAGEGEQEEEQTPVFYDKNVSFFDNISCEAVERSKGRSQRTDWRTERKLNSETFGVASARRGGYRGRGYYGNRGMGGMYRGGFRGGYRGQGGQRGRGNNQGGNAGPTQNNLQQRSIVQQSK